MDMSTQTEAEIRLSAERLAQCHADGFVIVEDLFSAEEVRQLKAVANDAVANNTRGTGVCVFMADALPEMFLRMVTDDRLVGILKQIIGSEVEFLSIKPVFKSKSVRFGSPWHQDYAYWLGSHKWSVWIALDDATPENGCLKVIPGTHRSVIEHAGVQGDHGFENRIPDATLAGMREVTASVKAGSAIFFHDLLVHGSHENVAGEDRWSFIPTYRDASVPDSSPVWSSTIAL